MAQGIKTGGRKKGTSNKLTKELREVLKDLLEQEFKNISKELNKLDPLDRLNLMVKIIPFVIPKYSDTIYQEPTQKPGSFHIIEKLDQLILLKEGEKEKTQNS
jgi:hypothetical protein